MGAAHGLGVSSWLNVAKPQPSFPPIQKDSHSISCLLNSGDNLDPSSSNEEDISAFIKLANFVYSQYLDSKGIQKNFREKLSDPGQENFGPLKKSSSFFPVLLVTSHGELCQIPGQI